MKAHAPSLDDTLAALSDPTRRKVIELLREQPRRAGELAEAFDMVAPAMSRHLRILRKSGLVAEGGLEHDARVRVYHLRREPFAELRGWLDEIEAFWAEQLAGFKALAESSRKAGAQPRRHKGRGQR